MGQEYGNDFITLVDEDGVENEFEHIDTVEMNDSIYVALLPVYNSAEESLSDSDELVILKIVTDEESGDELLSTIEDDDEYDEIAQVFAGRLEDYYEIEN